MKPKVFIGSSVEGLPIAYAVQQNLRHTAEVTVWDQGVFQLSETALDSLQEVLSASDFGIFIFSPDDIVKIRGKENTAVRDNVVFELGLFVGKLSKKRCFILIPDKNAEMHLPTDLVGMTPATYETGRTDGSFQRGSGPACHEIRDAMAKMGLAFTSRNTTETSPVVEATNAEQTAQQSNQPEKAPEKKAEGGAKASNWAELLLDKKYKEATKLLKTQLAKAKKKDLKAEKLAQIAFVAFEENIKEGRDQFERIIEAHPKEVSVYMFYSFAFLRHDLHDECLSVVERGIASVGNFPPLLIRKVGCMCDLGKSKEAIPILTQGISEHPTEPRFYEELAKIHQAAGDKLDARKILVAGIKLLPDKQTLLDQYGRLLHDSQEHDSAMLIYEKLRDLDDKNAAHWTMLGNQYLSLELYDLAWIAYKKGKELSPKENSGWILGNIGNLLNNKALFTEGIEYLREGISIEPTSEYNHNRLSDTLKGQQLERENAEKIRKEARRKYLTVPPPPNSSKT